MASLFLKWTYWAATVAVLWNATPALAQTSPAFQPFQFSASPPLEERAVLQAQAMQPVSTAPATISPVISPPPALSLTPVPAPPI
jgi:hypothetical protein